MAIHIRKNEMVEVIAGEKMELRGVVSWTATDERGQVQPITIGGKPIGSLAHEGVQSPLCLFVRHADSHRDRQDAAPTE